MGHAIYHDSFSTDMSRDEIFSIVNQRAIEEVTIINHFISLSVVRIPVSIH